MQIAPGPKPIQAQYNPPKGERPIVKETGMGSGVMWEAYKMIKGIGDYTSESVVHRDDQLNPGGGGCIWEPGQSESTAVCTPINGGHAMIPSATNARGQFDYKLANQTSKGGKSMRRFIG
jgi:hypothetical protein